MAFFLEILKLMFLSEVAHRSFRAKFSELRILEKSQVREYSPYRFIFGLFLKARKSTFQDK